MMADEGVRQGKLFDDILAEIRVEFGLINSPKKKDVYDYLTENYERDKLFSNKFTIKKLLPDPLKDLENTQNIIQALHKTMDSVSQLKKLYEQMQSENVMGEEARQKHEKIELAIAEGFNICFELLEAIENTLDMS